MRKEGRVLDDLKPTVPPGFRLDPFTNEIYDPSKEFHWDPEIIELFEPKEKKSAGPLTISAHGFTYTHIEDTETFYLTSPEQPLTALKVMKAIAPDIVRSKYQRIVPPQKFFNFGDSTRFKIIKAVQAHYECPTPSEETDQFIPFFDTLSENVQDHWTVQQQYSAAKWACQQDKSRASSLLLHYGWSPRHEPRMLGSSMHKITIAEDGVLVDMAYTHLFQERLDAACSEALLTCEDLKRREMPIETEAIRTVALRTFYYFKEKYISLSNEYAMGVKSKIQSYIDSLVNPLDNAMPLVPQIEEPEDLLEDDTILLKWDDFIFDDSYSFTSAAYAQRMDNNRKAAYLVAAEKLKHLPQGVPLEKKQFPPNIADTNFAAWKKFGFLQSPKRGIYIITLPDEGDEQ